MQTVQIKTFKFNELEGAAREKALEWGRECCQEDYEFITEIFKEQLIDRGYDLSDIRWSLGCCQGDGMAFYGQVDLDILAKKDSHVMHLLRKAARLVKIRYRTYPVSPDCEAAQSTDCWDFTVSIASNHYGDHYNHFNTMSVSCEVDIHDDPENRLDSYVDGERNHWINPYKKYPPKLYGLSDVALEIEEHIQERVQEISKELEKLGYKEIEYQTSDKAVAEFIEVNEYDFNINGSRSVTL